MGNQQLRGLYRPGNLSFPTGGAEKREGKMGTIDGLHVRGGSSGGGGSGAGEEGARDVGGGR
jgi:hypothetical protein